MKNNFTMNENRNFILFLMLIFSFAVYANSFMNGWTLDDIPVIVNNPDLKSISAFLNDSYPGRPIRELTYLVDYSIFGLNPAGWHIQSIFWHALNGFLLFQLALKLGIQRIVAALVSFCFLAHPLHVEAVANLSNRKDPLALAFVLLALLSYIKANEVAKPWLWRSAAFFSFGLGLLAKQTAIVWLPVVIVYEFIFVAPEERWLLRKPWLVVVCSAILVLMIGVWFFFFGGKELYVNTLPRIMTTMNKAYLGDFTGYVLLVLKGWTFGFLRIVWPVDLAAEYVFDVKARFGDAYVISGIITLLSLLLFVLIGYYRKWKVMVFGVVWFLLFWLPTSNVWPLAYFAADRYCYAPLAGICLLLGGVVHGLQGHRNLVNGVVAILIFVLSILTFEQNKVWRNNETLWTKSVAVSPLSTTALINLGIVHMDKGDLTAAQRSFERAAQLMSDSQAYYFLGKISEIRGDRDGAIRHYRTFLMFNDKRYIKEAEELKVYLAKQYGVRF